MKLRRRLATALAVLTLGAGVVAVEAQPVEAAVAMQLYTCDPGRNTVSFTFNVRSNNYSSQWVTAQFFCLPHYSGANAQWYSGYQPAFIATAQGVAYQPAFQVALSWWIHSEVWYRMAYHNGRTWVEDNWVKMTPTAMDCHIGYG